MRNPSGEMRRVFFRSMATWGSDKDSPQLIMNAKTQSNTLTITDRGTNTDNTWLPPWAGAPARLRGQASGG